MFNERVEDFVRETGKRPPMVEHLSQSQCQRFQSALALKLLGADDADGASLVVALRDRQVMTRMALTDRGFSLRRVFKELGIRPAAFVLVNWAQFNLIDRFENRFIADDFQDFVYPGGDYVDVFDEELSWVVSIDYECRVLVAVLNGASTSRSPC